MPLLVGFNLFSAPFACIFQVILWMCRDRGPIVSILRVLGSSSSGLDFRWRLSHRSVQRVYSESVAKSVEGFQQGFLESMLMGIWFVD